MKYVLIYQATNSAKEWKKVLDAKRKKEEPTNDATYGKKTVPPEAHAWVVRCQCRNSDPQSIGSLSW